MKKIYWFVNQYIKRGGTEIVTNQIINFLKEDYDITTVLLSNEIDDHLFDVKNNKIVSLNIDKEIIRNEDYYSKNIFKNLKIAFKVLFYFLFKRYKYRKVIKKMTDESDILIFSSVFGYAIAPKNRKNYFHIHYNDQYINRISNQIVFKLFSHKPTKYIVLSKGTLEAIKLRPAIYIYNPVRVGLKENYEVNDIINIIFMARFEKDKNPLLALEVANELSKLNTNFTFSFYGDGYERKNMENYLKNHAKLNYFVKIYGRYNDPCEVLEGKDILVMTSKSEGFGLTLIEAATQSIPSVLFDFGAGCNEVINNGIDGIILEYFSAKEMATVLNELIKNKNKLIELKKGAYKNAQRFSPDKIKGEREKFLNEEFKR